MKLTNTYLFFLGMAFLSLEVGAAPIPDGRLYCSSFYADGQRGSRYLSFNFKQKYWNSDLVIESDNDPILADVIHRRSKATSNEKILLNTMRSECPSRVSIDGFTCDVEMSGYPEFSYSYHEKNDEITVNRKMNIGHLRLALNKGDGETYNLSLHLRTEEFFPDKGEHTLDLSLQFQKCAIVEGKE